MSTTEMDQATTPLRPLPSKPDDLTASWLTAALRHGEVDGVVSGFHARTIGEGSGLMSVLLLLDLDYASGSGPSSVVVKLPTHNEANRATAIAYHCYQREVRYYLDAAHRSPARTPDIYFADVVGDEEMAIIMEDLSAYGQGNQVVGCGLPEAEACMDLVAQLHAAFWGDVDRPDLDFVPYHHPSYFSDGLHQGAVAFWDQLAELYGDAVPASIDALKDRYLAAIPGMQAWITGGPRTIVHGDFRLENMFFGQSAEHAPVAICDWQGILRGKGIHDVAYFLSQSLPIELRRAHERDLVARWHAGLVEGGVTAYGVEQAWEDYRRAVLYLWTYVAVIGGSLDPGNERGVGWMSEMVRRSAAAIEDLDTIGLLPEFEQPTGVRAT